MDVNLSDRYIDILAEYPSRLHPGVSSEIFSAPSKFSSATESIVVAIARVDGWLVSSSSTRLVLSGAGPVRKQTDEPLAYLLLATCK